MRKLSEESIFWMICKNLKEGREGVKWELGFALFSAGKMGLTLLGLGCYHWGWDLKNETGNGIPIFGSAQTRFG